MITPVDLISFLVKDVIGLDISEDKKERYLEIIVRSASEGLARGAVQK